MRQHSSQHGRDATTSHAAAALVGAGIILWAAGFGLGGLISIIVALALLDPGRRAVADAPSSRVPPALTAIDLIALVLAVGQVVDTWENGEILAGWREAAARQADRYRAGRWWLVGAGALDCPYCLTHWVAAALVAAAAVPPLAWPAAAGWAMLPVYALAVCRLSLLVDGLLPPDLRYARAGIGANAPDEAASDE